ncbi:hypothetical protein O197_35 [Edwardsiella phage eiAU-183]|uniref:Uncharacterized protein n=2 Tax=Eiauvirus eiAU TaxID=1982112 RepID=W0LI65_9CAUD|nr:hypothetical protein CH09_gp35 [Edwardsiella phage eiAU-183]YP_009613885.1 hypothetical protein FDI58_gp35 [Edwardsiella phage eiAU]AHG23451.1 hypothetical protein P858_35 [Edwardsiella phage eiAU]AHG23505.1 hypothetical protein O197_35 [Edwardsiella phage eiAU-183]
MNEFESALFIDLDKAVTTTKELHAENEALRTRLAAADSLIAELKQREADRLSAVVKPSDELAKKYEQAARERDALKQDRTVIIRERDELQRQLELTRRDLAREKTSNATRPADDNLVRGEIMMRYIEVFGQPKTGVYLNNEEIAAALARLAQYAKAGYRLNNAMAEVETATRQYESLSGPHAFTVDIVAEITERADRRAAKAGVEPIGINGTLDAKKLSRDYRINDKIDELFQHIGGAFKR